MRTVLRLTGQIAIDAVITRRRQQSQLRRGIAMRVADQRKRRRRGPPDAGLRTDRFSASMGFVCRDRSARNAGFIHNPQCAVFAAALAWKADGRRSHCRYHSYPLTPLVRKVRASPTDLNIRLRGSGLQRTDRSFGLKGHRLSALWWATPRCSAGWFAFTPDGSGVVTIVYRPRNVASPARVNISTALGRPARPSDSGTNLRVVSS